MEANRRPILETAGPAGAQDAPSVPTAPAMWPLVWMNGELVPAAQATIPVTAHALHYGCAVFEGVRAYETAGGAAAVFRLDEHLRRLERSAHIQLLPIPFARDVLRGAVHAVLAAREPGDAYIRPIVLTGAGALGLDPGPADIVVAIAAWDWPVATPPGGIRAKVSSFRRLEHNTHPPASKASGNYVNSLLARREATLAGYDEAILLNGAGLVADGSVETVFCVRDGAVTTPPLHAGCLDGITRDTLLTLAGELGHETREVDLSRADLYCADEVFLAGTASEVVPVRSVDDRAAAASPGPVTTQLRRAYMDVVRGRSSAHAGWLDYA